MNTNRKTRSGPIVAVIACLLVVARLSVAWVLGEWSAWSWTYRIGGVVIGLALAIVLAHGLRAATSLRDGSSNSQSPRLAVWWLWVGWLMLAICALPAALQVNRYSLASLLVFGSLLSFPAAWVDRPMFGARFSWASHHAEKTYRWLVIVLLSAACGSSVIYLHAARRDIGSVDFFYYICASRDMLADGVTVSDHCYTYFPGVYAFWRTVMQWVGTSLRDLQTSYLAVLIANALLTAALARRLTRSVLVGALAAIWYLVLISRFEGFAGVSEPLATAPLLAGCLIWGGQPLVGRRGYLLAACLGIALGLAVYFKQQAGLLTLGTISLLVLRPAMAAERKHGWIQLALLPVAAAVALLLGVQLEGKGWVPLTEGLTFAARYQAEGSLLRNLYTQIRGDESAALAAALMVIAWCGMFWKQRRSAADTPQFQLASFAVFAFLFTLVQFASRPYGHYMLLGIPFLVLGTVLLAHAYCAELAEPLSRSLLVRALLVCCVAVPFFNTAGRSNTYYGWRYSLPEDFHANTLWHEEPARSRDIATLREVVPPRSRMYVLPQRHNSIYYLLEAYTASPAGYTFVETDWDQFPWEDCDYFILLTRGLNQYDYQFTSAARIEETRKRLGDNGFHLRTDLDLTTMEFYERPETP